MTENGAISPSDPAIRVSMPDADMAQDSEWCDVHLPAGTRRVRFHDYDEIYAIPGLYEHLFYDLLRCTSPATLADMLAAQMDADGIDPATVRALDLGAGNGIMGEELRGIGVSAVVGVDIIEEARDAALRDRPGVYDAYLAAKQRLADPAFQRELRGTKGPGYISQLSQDLREGRVPVRYDYGEATAEVKSSVGQFYAQEQKDGSILIKENYNFYYAPEGKQGENKAGAATREPFLPFTPANIGRNLVRGGVGKPFGYSLRIWPDGRVRVNPR